MTPAFSEQLAVPIVKLIRGAQGRNHHFLVEATPAGVTASCSREPGK